MKAGWTVGKAALVAALALVTPPLAAQSAPVTNNSAGETIGPRELRDFNLNGAVTRPAPGPVVTPPATPRPQPEPGATQPPSSAPATAAPPLTPSERALAAPPAAATDSVALPPVGALEQSPTPAPPSGAPFDSQPNAGPPAVPPSASMPIDTGPSLWPWLLAALLIGGAALYFALRQRQRPRPALAGQAMAFRAPAPDFTPPPAPAPPPPPAAPSPPADPGLVVSTALRPTIDIEFAPVRAIVDEQRATIEFELVVRNSGAAPARDVLVEACMFNAGPAQDQDIRAFFAHPVGQGDRIAIIMPLGHVMLKSSVSLTRAQLREFEIGGRILFVPLIGFNALYRLGGGEAQTSVSFLVGRDGDGEKMAPLRLDLGPRQFRGLGARPLGIGLRK